MTCTVSFQTWHLDYYYKRIPSDWKHTVNQIHSSIIRIYGSTYSRNGADVPYIQYKMFTFMKYQQQIPKASKLVRGSFRHYANYLLEENSQKLSRSRVVGAWLTRSHKSAILFISDWLTWFFERAFQGNRTEGYTTNALARNVAIQCGVVHWLWISITPEKLWFWVFLYIQYSDT